VYIIAMVLAIIEETTPGKALQNGCKYFVLLGVGLLGLGWVICIVQ